MGEMSSRFIVKLQGERRLSNILFEVVVSHTCKILSVSSVFFGADNDKTIAQFDPAINKIHNGSYSETKWEHCCYNDTRVKECRYYFISDGGYFSWKCLMLPVQNRAAGSDVDNGQSVWNLFERMLSAHLVFSSSGSMYSNTMFGFRIRQ